MQPASRLLVVCALFMLPLAARAKEAAAQNKKGKPETVTGVLGDKAAGTSTHVLAQMTDVKATGKAKDAPNGPLNLVGSNQTISTEIKDLLAKKAKVSVTGTLKGTTLTVTSIKELTGGGGVGGKKVAGKKKGNDTPHPAAAVAETPKATEKGNDTPPPSAPATAETKEATTTPTETLPDKTEGSVQSNDIPPVAPTAPEATEGKETTTTLNGTLADKTEGCEGDVLAQLTDVKDDKALSAEEPDDAPLTEASGPRPLLIASIVGLALLSTSALWLLFRFGRAAKRLRKQAG